MMTKKAQAVFNKLAGIGSFMDKLPKGVRKGVLATTMTGALATGAKASERGKWVDVVANTTSARRAAEMTGGDAMRAIPNWKAPHSGTQNIKLRLATGSEPDSLINTSLSHKEVVTADPKTTSTVRRISSFSNR